MSGIDTFIYTIYTVNRQKNKEKAGKIMEFRDNYCYELHTDMSGLEQVLKSAYLSSRDFPYQLPHSLSEVTPVLRRVGLKCSQPMTDLLLHSDLEEKNFFSDDMDTAIFRHIRYLPAY